MRHQQKWCDWTRLKRSTARSRLLLVTRKAGFVVTWKLSQKYR